MERFPKVVLLTRQPWALRRNPVGIQRRTLDLVEKAAEGYRVMRWLKFMDS